MGNGEIVETNKNNKIISGIDPEIEREERLINFFTKCERKSNNGKRFSKNWIWKII